MTEEEEGVVVVVEEKEGQEGEAMGEDQETGEIGTNGTVLKLVRLIWPRLVFLRWARL